MGSKSSVDFEQKILVLFNSISKSPNFTFKVIIVIGNSHHLHISIRMSTFVMLVNG